MKELLESYDVLFLLMGLSCVALLMKVVSYVMFHHLLWASERMGATKNQWLKSMMSRFEAYYKLKISVHNVGNFVDRYLYHYTFWGMSLKSWENLGYYFIALLTACSVLLSLTAGYFGLDVRWYFVNGIVSLVLLSVQAAAEIFFDTHRCFKILRIQIVDYMENTMRAKLENEIFHAEEMKQYQMEYFRPPEKGNSRDGADGPGKAEGDSVLKAGGEGRDLAGGTGGGERTEKGQDGEEKKGIAAAMEPQAYSAQAVMPQGDAIPELQELFQSLAEEKRLDGEIAEHKKALSARADKQRAQLFEEILEEFL